MIHISKFKRHDKMGIMLGGVEKFAQYLKDAIPEMESYSWTDYPKWVVERELPDYVKAEHLNNWLIENGKIGRDDTVVVDGYWGLGLEGKVSRLISVCHGSYFGRFVQAMINPWGEQVMVEELSHQLEMWSHPRVEVVCVAQEGVKELRQIGIEKDIEVIYHGVDLDTYKPLGLERTIVMHAATSARKGSDIVRIMTNAGMKIEFMDEKSGSYEREANRLNQARFLFAPSRHEGNSYLLIEALACGTPVLTYATGLAPEFDFRCGVVKDDYNIESFRLGFSWMEMIETDPRAWAEENCDFNTFKDRWREYLAYSSGNSDQG